MPKPQLADARRLAGLTQQQLADRVGLNRVQLAKYESGAQSPSVAIASRIARALDASVEELFADSPHSRPTPPDHATRIERLEARLAVLEERFGAAETRPAREVGPTRRRSPASPRR